MASIDWKTIQKHLRLQGWTLERTANRHLKAFPPDKSRPLVTFSESLEPRAIHNSLSQLKASGFQWPPTIMAQKLVAGSADDDDDWIEEHNARVAPEDIVKKKEAPVSSASPPEAEEERVNRIFEELKEAKLHATLAREQLDAARVKLDEARAQHIQAQSELDAAVRTLQEKKQSFDRLFSVNDPAPSGVVLTG